MKQQEVVSCHNVWDMLFQGDTQKYGIIFQSSHMTERLLKVALNLKQTKRLPRSVCVTAQSYQGLLYPLTESLNNVERIDVHVYTKVLSDSLADLGVYC